MIDKKSGLANNLLAQLDKLIRHNRQGSYKTRKRYTEAMRRFCIFVASTYRLQKLANIKEKHIEAYVDFMKEKGLSPAIIKTNLSGTRFWHDQIPSAREKLPENSTLNLERRNFREKERAWTQGEFNKMICICWEQNREDYAAILCLGRYGGLRIHECFRIYTAIATSAIKSGAITIKGKGGLIRSVPINENIEICLRDMLKKIPRGHKLFVPYGVPTHKAIKELQQFIAHNRDKVQSSDRDVKLTFHGLRHLYACDKHREFTKGKLPEANTNRKVSQLLGHKRGDITKIYLTSLNRTEVDS